MGVWDAAMKTRGTVIVLVAAATLATVARSGHEQPVYPSYYPHEIEISATAPGPAALLLATGKLHAFVGEPPNFAGAPPDSVRAVESLGSFLVVRANPAQADKESTCTAARAFAADLAGRAGEFVFHPYPVTPLHGDYLHHVDLAEAAKARLLETKAELATREPKVRASGGLARSLVRPAWLAVGNDWDVELMEVEAAELVRSSTLAINGWLGPSWLKEGWFHALRLLGDSFDAPEAKARVEALAKRLEAHDFHDPAERINLERELVATLADSCRARVVGYTIKREYFNAEFSNGIENIAFDSITGMNSAIFLRTVKLKDFPWNGWLALGIAAPPAAAWNPIGGFGDPFGRLMWSAIGDPVLLPSPYGSEWMFNRASEVGVEPKQTE
jgi:hypothetical protein